MLGISPAVIALYAQSAKGPSLTELTSEFKRLRAIPGHFKGSSWNDEIDAWQGRKHRVMIALASHINQAHYTSSDLKRLMGEPDRTIQPSDPGFSQTNQWALAGHSTASLPDMYFLYEWRGDHDFLIFACRKEGVLFSKWRYAGE